MFAREPRLLSVNIASTSLKWLLMIVSYVCGFRAFGVAVPFAAAATLPVMSSLVGYVPVSVGGLGTTEWTAVALFGRLGIPEPTVLAVFLFLRTSVLGMAILLSATRRSPRRGDPESAPGLTARGSPPQSDAGCRRG